MRRVVDIWSPAIGAAGAVIAYGHWGLPVLVFPSEAGRAGDFESNGMVDAVADLLDQGRIKLYCVDSYDAASWSDRGVPLEERARRHGAFESWILDQVVPFVHGDCGGPTGVLTTGVSMGAFHAANFALRRADLFPRALCLSGNYDPSTWHGWGEQGEALYFQNPTAYVPGLHGDHLEWLRHHVRLTLVCGQGMWEDTTGALNSTRTLAGLLAGKGIPHELDMWGYDVAHDWPWWRRQLPHHLHRMT
jgi:esterase/lipase superfamily enzyme